MKKLENRIKVLALLCIDNNIMEAEINVLVLYFDRGTSAHEIETVLELLEERAIQEIEEKARVLKLRHS